MLFESQSKADNFIKYNREGILEENGKAPIRSYYCEFCCGYHVTSNPSSTQGNELDKRDISRRNKLIADNKKSEDFLLYLNSIEKNLERARNLMKSGKIIDAEDMLDVCDVYLNEMNRFSMKERIKAMAMRGKVNQVRTTLALLKDVMDLPLEEQLKYISDDSKKEQNMLQVRHRLADIICDRIVVPILNDNDELLKNRQIEGLSDRIAYCYEILKYLDISKRKAMTEIKQRLSKQAYSLTKIASHSKKKQEHDYKLGDNKRTETNVNENSSQEDTGHELKYYINEDEYNATLVSLIEKIESIVRAYEQKDYNECRGLLEISYAILDNLQIEDKNTALIRTHLDNWSNKMSELDD